MQFVGYVNREWSRRADNRNAVLVTADSENEARTAAESILGAQEGSLGDSEDSKGWVFAELDDQNGFFEGHFVSADPLLGTVAKRGS